jgi:hypothetical protein
MFFNARHLYIAKPKLIGALPFRAQFFYVVGVRLKAHLLFNQGKAIFMHLFIHGSMTVAYYN